MEIVQLMSEMDRINAETTQGPDVTSSDILIAGGVTWNKWLQILRQNYKENKVLLKDLGLSTILPLIN